MTTTRSVAERRITFANLVGLALGALVAVLVSTGGTFDLFARQPVSDFYDAQAQAWLDGTWEIGIDTLNIEAFFWFDDQALAVLESGRLEREGFLASEAFYRGEPAYMYQGPVPALLRLPIAAITDDMAGRLTALSILVASCVSGWLVGRIVWFTRTVLRPDARVGRAELIGVGTLTFVTVGGSTLVYLAAKPWVYHEAAAWGVALTLGALLAAMRYAREPSTRSLLLLAALATAALLTRASVGAGPLVAVAALAGGQLIAEARTRWPDRAPRWLDRLGWAAPAASGWRPFVGPTCVALVAVGAYAAVNYTKFRTPFSIEFDWQFFSMVDTHRQAFLAEHGSFFGPQFVPTTLVQYFRPDAFRLSGLFPWIEFAPPPGWIAGETTFDVFDRTASVPTSMPVFVALGALGAVATVRRWFGPVRQAPLAIGVLGAAGSGLTVLPFGYIANRYLADFVPLMVVVGCIGLHAWLQARPTLPLRGRRALSVSFAALALAGTWLNISHGLLYQGRYATVISEGRAAAFLSAQDAIADWSPWTDGLEGRLSTGDSLPDDGRAGDLRAIGDCDALYFNDGVPPNNVRPHSWIPVERTTDGGRYELTVRFADPAADTKVPLMSGEGPDGPMMLSLETTADGHQVFEYRSPRFSSRGIPVDLEPGRSYDVVVVADPHVLEVSVTIDGERALGTYYHHTGPVALGRNVVADTPVGAEVAARFDGEIVVEDGDDAPLCRRLVDEAMPVD